MNNHQYTARVDVQTNGVISWHAGGRSHRWISLSGITFDVGAGKTLPMKNGWRAYAGSYGTPTYSVRNGMCSVQGLARGSRWGHIATLPGDCRPKKRLIFNLNNHQSTARVDVNTNGVIKWVTGGRHHGWISLTGIIFGDVKEVIPIPPSICC